MNRFLFDIDLLCVFVMVVDCGSFMMVFVCLYLMQLMVSQKVCWFEEIVGYWLFDCGMCDVWLIDVGVMVFSYVWCMFVLNDEMLEVLLGVMVVLMIWFGVFDDFVVGCMMYVFVVFKCEYLQVKFEVMCGLSCDISVVYDCGEFDFVLIKQWCDSCEVVVCWLEKLCWIDSVKYLLIDFDLVLIVVFLLCGFYCDDMIKVIEECGCCWWISFMMLSLSGIQVVVVDGFGISVLFVCVVMDEYVVLIVKQGFVLIEYMDIVILYWLMVDLMVSELMKVFVVMLEFEGW